MEELMYKYDEGEYPVFKNINLSFEKGKVYAIIGRSGKEKSEIRVLRFSGGKQQRVAIARALSYNPDVILADEPTGNQDKQNEEHIMSIFTNLAPKNKCVIIVTHSDNVSNQVDEVFDLEKYKYKSKLKN